MSAARPWPEELRLNRATGTLEIRFEGGDKFALPAEFLRVNSPSAEVKGHGGEKPRPVAGKARVGVKDMVPVGNYAVRIVFDDGHDTGLFSWDYLHELGRDQIKLWNEYLARLDHSGMSREP